MPGLSVRARALRLLVPLLVGLLLPLAGGLAAAPAHATPNVASGGVVDGLGDPLTGVTVTALAAPTYTTTVATTTSTTGGTYQLPLGSGTYHLRFDLAGHEQAFYGGGSGADVVVDGAGDISVGGEPVEGNVLDDLTLTSAAHQVSGVVRDTDGAALGGITVQAFAPGDETTVLDEATTAAGSGAYVLEVPTGIYHVRYTDPSGTHVAQWYGGDQPQDVTVNGSRTLDPVVFSRPASRFPVAGTVVDALGDPVSGVSVSVTGTGGSTDSGTDTTGPTGTYSVQVLPGTYRVQLARTGWESTAVGGQATPSTVTVAADGTLAVTPAEALVANRLPAVVLRSTPFAVTGVVATTDGTPLAGITVRALPEGSSDPDDAVDAATSSASGSYTLDLPVGAYDLEHVDVDGVRPTYATASLLAVHVHQGGALTVDGDPVASLPEQRLAISSADTPHPVVGSVVDLNGDAVDGLTVSAVPYGGGTAVTATTGADGGLGDHGRYRLALVPGSYEVMVDGGAHWRDAPYTGGGTAPALVNVQLNGTVLVNGVEAVGAELGPTTIEGRTTYALGGIVTDGSAALAGITVTAYAESDPGVAVATTTTLADGSWSLAGATGLPVGRYLVGLAGTVGDVAYEPTWFGGATPTTVVVSQGGIATVAGATVADNVLPVVTMTPSPTSVAHAVVGTVVDVNHDPVAGATVTAVPQGSTPDTQRTTATSSADGRWRLDVRPGTYRLTFTAAGFSGATPVDVAVGVDGAVVTGTSPVASGDLGSTVLVDALGTASVSGRVVDTDGRPVAGATVDVLRVSDLAGAPVATTRTSDTGAWAVTGLPIGTYVLRLTDGAAPPVVRGPVKVGQGDVVSVDGVPVADGATGDVVVPAPVAPPVVPPVVVPPVVVPPVVLPPVVLPPVVLPPVVLPPVVLPPAPSRPGAPAVRKALSGAKGGPSTATVRWGVPDDGGSDLTSYRVQVIRLSPSGGVARRTTRLAEPTARGMVLRLAPGSYRFRVSAVNAVGQSPWSALSRRVAAR